MHWTLSQNGIEGNSRQKNSIVSSSLYLKCRVYMDFEGNLQGQRTGERDHDHLELRLFF